MEKQKNNEIGVALVKEACPGCLTEMDGGLIMNRKIGNKAANKRLNDMNGKVVGIADHFCEECEEWSKKGIIIITVDEKKTDDISNPWRTGGFFVLKDDYIKKLMDESPALLERTLKHRMCYMPHEVAEGIGLFNKPEDEVS